MNYQKINNHFIKVRDFVARRYPRLGRFRLRVGCPIIAERRRNHPEGYRAYMHIGHQARTICVSPLVERLPGKYLYGLFLHEFGHEIGGVSQADADIAILEKFNIPIGYDKKKDLQYIKI